MGAGGERWPRARGAAAARPLRAAAGRGEGLEEAQSRAMKLVAASSSDEEGRKRSGGGGWVRPFDGITAARGAAAAELGTAQHLPCGAPPLPALSEGS